MFELILLFNAIWFAMGFITFALRGKVFGKGIVPRAHRESPLFDTLVETGKFLGGFNLAFCILNLFILIDPGLFPDSKQRMILCLVFAVAHGSQFLPNLPIAIKNRKGEGVWQVKGTMLFIFITDFILMLANLIIAGMYAY